MSHYTTRVGQPVTWLGYAAWPQVADTVIAASVGYGRLREACQTDVDGTSIDTLEAIAVQLGLEAEQVMLPVDHLLVKARHGCLYIFAESSRLYLRKSQLNEQVCGVEAKHTRHRRETLR